MLTGRCAIPHIITHAYTLHYPVRSASVEWTQVRLNFKRAFDCLNRIMMFTKLIHLGYSSKMLDILISMYSKTKSVIKWKGMLSAAFCDLMGVAQGGITSPFLFRSFLSDLSEGLRPDLGVCISDMLLSHLLWADDLFLVSTSSSNLQQQINNLERYCSKWQLVVNTLKTKILVYGKKEMVDQTFVFRDEPIEVATDYTYLGNPMCSVGNPFGKVGDHVLQKCLRACYKIREYCEPLGQVPPYLALHFYNTLILPYMDYGSEIWYRKSIARRFETFSLQYFKRALHVRPQTPTLAVYGEFGVYPIETRLICNVLKFLHRLHNMSHSIPAAKVYDDLCTLADAGYDTWVKRARDLYSQFQNISNINLESFLSLSKSSMKCKLKSAFHKAYDQSWLHQLNDSENCPKLRTYKTFKDKFCFENYLYVPDAKARTALARFRTSSRDLEIEIGRHHKPDPLPISDRLCKECLEVEDEVHRLLQCKRFQALREPVIVKCKLANCNFSEMSTLEQFKFMMSSNNRGLLSTIGNFLFKAQSTS